jgi:hypothetical protein
MARICARAEPCRSVSFFCAIGLPLVVTALLLAGCQRETEASVPEIRPVRVTFAAFKADGSRIVTAGVPVQEPFKS